MKDLDYNKTKKELDELLSWFESGNQKIDEALDKYKRAEFLIDQLEAYLKDTKSKVDKMINKVDSNG